MTKGAGESAETSATGARASTTDRIRIKVWSCPGFVDTPDRMKMR